MKSSKDWYVGQEHNHSDPRFASDDSQRVISRWRAIPAHRVLLLWRRDARGLAPRGAVSNVMTPASRRLGEAPPRSCSPRRKTRCDRVATSDERQVGSCRRWFVVRLRRPTSSTLLARSAGWPTSRRLPRTDDVAGARRDGRDCDGRRDGTPVAWTVSQVGSRADAAPGAHQTTTAFRRRRPTPACPYLLAAGVYGIGWSVECRVRENMKM